MTSSTCKVMAISFARAAVAVCMVTVPGLAADALPGTKPWDLALPLDEAMVDGIDRFALRAIAESRESRAARWTRDYSSPAAYDQSVAANRERLRVILGVVDRRVPAKGVELLATTERDEIVGRSPLFTARSVRWSVLDGVTAEGLLLEPVGRPVARVVAVPDADWTPEQFSGLMEGVPAEQQLGRRLAENGCQVLVPLVLSREQTFSGHPDVRFTNQPHREFIYRQAFEMGRHVIGYEVQKILAAVDQCTRLNESEQVVLPIGVAGIGEGGLLAQYAAAVDPRIAATWVGGYFGPRDGVWQEPIYRNVWALLTEFGDSDLASLVAPRGLVIEAGRAPEVEGPPTPLAGRSGGAAPGRIVSPAVADVQAEAERARHHFQSLQAADRLVVVVPVDEEAGCGSEEATRAFFAQLSAVPTHGGASAPASPQAALQGFDPDSRLERQMRELVDFTQRLLRRSARVRDDLWSKASRASLDDWERTAEPYRQMVYDELIGRLPPPTMPLNPRTREVLDEPGYKAYEVLLDVYPDVIAGGVLLLPKDVRPGEKRPVVVCQHGLEGVPIDTLARAGKGFGYYAAFAHELANRGFITYAPQNPYRGQDRFRTLQRKSNPLKRSLFSYIIPQHERTLEFLKGLPAVNPERIAFYGLSYGGKTAVRVPPLVKDYCLSICSADFNEWVLKNTTVYDGSSYVFTGEYEIFEWNMGHTANYAELSNLMTPRPFMVERGHGDGVAPDEWVAWEYAKVRRHYAVLGLADKTEIEFFNGPHTINGVQTYEFLHKHLNWPKR